MRFEINCAEYWGVIDFLEKYKKLLKDFNLEIDPYDEHTKYEASAYIIINSLEELIELSKVVDNELVVDAKQMKITIYDYWLE
jgi:hypothetical protein